MKYDAAPLPGYAEPYGQLLAILQDGTREWREELEETPVEAITWQPFPASHSIGALILHMIECEVFWFETIALGMPENDAEAKVLMSEEIKQYEGTWPTPPAKPLSHYFEMQDRIRARTLESVKRWGPPEGPVKTQWGEVSLRWILGHVIEHESYHGGQVVLLKALWEKQTP